MLEIPKSVTVSECILVPFSGRINIQLAIKIGQTTIKVEEPNFSSEQILRRQAQQHQAKIAEQTA